MMGMQRIYRHPLTVRITHWISALALGVLAMSGMQIFMAHPALYASDASKFNRPAFSIGSGSPAKGEPLGFVQIGHKRINTTHILGYTSDGMGGEAARAFPAWATIPAYQDLADGRRWHIFFAWIFVLCAAVYGFWALRLWPKRQDVRALPAAVKAHLIPWRVKQTAEVNPVQKISYFGIVFIVAPLVIVSGLALSPSVDAWAPWLPAALGGRQFARIWHFGGMIALIGFFVVHIVMVSLTGFFNNMKSMITGWLTASEVE